MYRTRVPLGRVLKFRPPYPYVTKTQVALDTGDVEQKNEQTNARRDDTCGPSPGIERVYTNENGKKKEIKETHGLPLIDTFFARYSARYFCDTVHDGPRINRTTMTTPLVDDEGIIRS